MQDAHGNTTAVNPDWLDDLALEVMQKLGEEPPAIVPDLAVVADMVSTPSAVPTISQGTFFLHALSTAGMELL